MVTHGPKPAWLVEDENFKLLETEVQQRLARKYAVVRGTVRYNDQTYGFLVNKANLAKTVGKNQAYFADMVGNPAATKREIMKSLLHGSLELHSMEHLGAFLGYGIKNSKEFERRSDARFSMKNKLDTRLKEELDDVFKPDSSASEEHLKGPKLLRPLFPRFFDLAESKQLVKTYLNASLDLGNGSTDLFEHKFIKEVCGKHALTDFSQDPHMKAKLDQEFYEINERRDELEQEDLVWQQQQDEDLVQLLKHQLDGMHLRKPEEIASHYLLLASLDHGSDADNLFQARCDAALQNTKKPEVRSLAHYMLAMHQVDGDPQAMEAVEADTSRETQVQILNAVAHLDEKAQKILETEV